MPFIKNRHGQILLPLPKYRKSIVLLMAVLFALASTQHPDPLKLICMLIWIAWLVALAAIDLQTNTLPNSLTLPFIVLGLIASLAGLTIPINDALIGMALGYLSFYLLSLLYQIMTRRIGVGFGDLKLVAALGAWMGWQPLPHIVLFASIAAAMTGVLLIVFKKRKINQYLPFGPFLALSAIIFRLIQPITVN